MLKRIWIAGVSALVLSTSLHATPLSFWDTDGYKMVTNDEGVADGGFVDPGWGGQSFDAEYLFYKWDRTAGTVTIGLQTGFDVVTGKVVHGGRNYYAGDLALTFDRLPGKQFAVDFGLQTRDKNGNLVDTGSGTGIDAMGVYEVSSWNNNINFGASAPYAMNGGTLKALMTTTSGYDAVAASYFRTVTFEYADLGLSTAFNMDMHWTMSCGNDAIDGTAHIPVPGSLPLLGLGLALVAVLRKRSQRS